jgi:hypothetical protein
LLVQLNIKKHPIWRYLCAIGIATPPEDEFPAIYLPHNKTKNPMHGLWGEAMLRTGTYFVLIYKVFFTT